MLIEIKKTLAAQTARVFLCLSFCGLMAACSNDAVNLNDPAAVYGNYCFACHDTGAAGAPLLSNQAFWQQSVNDKARLYESTLKGVRAMPAKGTCLSCSDEQLKQVVDWMVQQ